MSFKIFAASFVFLVNTNAFAQEKPKIVHPIDSTEVAYHLVMDMLVVTPRVEVPSSISKSRMTLAHGNASHKLASESDLTTTIPDVTADLERDLPGLITFYMPNGIPILTKQTQNHALTPAIPYNSIDLSISEPTAALSGPDAVVTFRPTYYATKNVVLDPLHQGASIAAGEDKMFSAAFVIEHTSPRLLENYIEELNAYAKTTSGLVAARFKTQNSKIEVVGQHLYSDNEFGALFDVNTFRNTSRMYSGFATVTHTFGALSLEAGYGQQSERTRNRLDEVYKELHSDEEALFAHSYKFGLTLHRTSLMVMHHNVDRSILNSFSNLRDTQVILTRKQPLRDYLHAIISGRVDYHDNETHPSASLKLIFEATNNLILTLNTAHLYDPIISMGMNSNLRDATNFTKPITTQFVSIHSNYTTSEWQVESDLKMKNVSLSWYNKAADIRGMVWGGSLQRTFWMERNALTLRLSSRLRWMKLDVNNGVQQMPGPTPFMLGFRTEYATDGYGISVDAQVYSSRTQSLADEVNIDLGGLILLNLGVSKRIGLASMGLSIGNSLGLVTENNLLAYQRRISETDSEVEFIVAPFIPAISVGFDF